jgi:hypothetical protein
MVVSQALRFGSSLSLFSSSSILRETDWNTSATSSGESPDLQAIE